MASWKKPKKWVCAVSMLLCLTILTACASNPTQQAVVSKNDGAFDANVVQSATTPDNVQTSGAQTVQHSETFYSTDGSVEFSMNIDQKIEPTAVPVVEVTPHFLTGEDARRVATALFGADAVFYEAEPVLAEVYSKEEISQGLAWMAQYTSVEKMQELFGYQGTSFLEGQVDTLKEYIKIMSGEGYEAAPENYERPECQWTFHPSSYYLYGPEAIANMDTSDDCEEINAWVSHNGINFKFSASTRNRNDYKLNILHAIPDPFDILELGYEAYRAEKLRTEKPTPEQIGAVEQKAQQMLNNMGLGTWLVDKSIVAVFEDGPYTEYTIKVSAVPVFNGMSALRRGQLNNLKSTAAYASNYYLTDAEFGFSANGDLINFSLYSPVDIKQVVNDNTAVLSMVELVDITKHHLTLTDAQAFGAAGSLQVMQSGAGEEIICKVNMCDLQYGLIRVKVPNTDDSYYYVPGIIVYGSVDYVGKESGNVYHSITWSNNQKIIPLVAVNAVDGTIIELENE